MAHFCCVDAMGSKPLFAMAGIAAGDARKAMSALAGSDSLALTAMPAEKFDDYLDSPVARSIEAALS